MYKHTIKFISILIFLLLILVTVVHSYATEAITFDKHIATPVEEPSTTIIIEEHKYVVPAPLDEIDQLFQKFDVPYQYQDYVRQLCELQNVDPIVFISLVQIESHWGNSKLGVTADYNKEVLYRMYGSKQQYTDLGLAQLSTRYVEEFERKYFNPNLIFSLGYIRYKFNVKDPYISLQTGCAYLGFLYRYFGDYETAVLAYNTGLGNVNKGKVSNVVYEYAHAIMHSWTYRERDL